MTKHPLRIVVKFGSGILANARGTALDERQFARLAAEIAGLVQAGQSASSSPAARSRRGSRNWG